MKLKDLLKDIPVLETNADMELDIQEIFYDSRKVQPGSLFVAVSGFASDGNRFIPMALSKGAAVVVTAKKPEGEVPFVLVESDRLALAMLGCNFYGHPAKAMTMVGVTGTNGKTSVTLLLKQVLETCLGAKVGLIGTMENQIGSESIPTERTTPESFELQGLFARMRDAGCSHVVMEVSSHASTKPTNFGSNASPHSFHSACLAGGDFSDAENFIHPLPPLRGTPPVSGGESVTIEITAAATVSGGESVTIEISRQPIRSALPSVAMGIATLRGHRSRFTASSKDPPRPPLRQGGRGAKRLFS